MLFNNRWTQLQAFITSIPSEAYRPLKINGCLYWTFSKVMPMKALRRLRADIVRWSAAGGLSAADERRLASRRASGLRLSP